MKGNNERNRIAKEAQEWIEKGLAPNVYAVVTLKQGLRPHPTANWIKGTAAIYEKQYGTFLRRLAKEMYGEKAWRRLKDRLLIPNMATLEGNGFGLLHNDWYSPRVAEFFNQPTFHQRAHINIMMRLPEDRSFFKFRFQFIECWRSMDWAMPDVFIEERTGNCIGYSLKEGMDSMLLDSAKF